MKDKVVIVTGGASGIGRAVVEQLVEQGAHVLLTDINDTLGTALAEALGDHAYFMHHNVSQRSDWEAVMAFVDKEFGRLDGLVNNAGTPGAMSSIEEIGEADLAGLFGVNTFSAYWGCKFATGRMKERGGSIVNISSNSALVGFPTTVIYAGTKGAICAMTRALAAHYKQAKLPIRVNTVLPGSIDTPIVRTAMKTTTGIDITDGSPEAAALLDQLDLGPASSVAATVVFLLSDAAEWVNGADYLVDGATSFSVRM